MAEERTIDRLIINSPYEEPARHWRYERETRGLRSLAEGRRPAGYVVASGAPRPSTIPASSSRSRWSTRSGRGVKAWREAGYPGRHQHHQAAAGALARPEEFEDRRFFFCQLEAIETLIWLTEAPAAERVGIDIPGDGGPFRAPVLQDGHRLGQDHRHGHGHRLAHPQQGGLSAGRAFQERAGGRARADGQEPPGGAGAGGPGNYYEEFNIVPSALLDKLRQGKVLVRNWHALAWDSEEQIKKRRSVDKRGAKSDEAYTREVLGEMANARNLLVINDEAHHAWRVNWEAEGKYLRTRDMKDSAEEATVWIGGLDRLQPLARGILTCYDFSATPFTPSGKKSSEEALFGWIVSDFGLNDAIESGLVKTPRVVVRDDAVPDAKTYKSRLYHIYNDPDVKDDLNRRPNRKSRCPTWCSTPTTCWATTGARRCEGLGEAGQPTPPVMITVCNRTETAARVKHAFDPASIHIDELCDPERILHIDSKVLDQAEARRNPPPPLKTRMRATMGRRRRDGPERKLTKAEQAELLRGTVDTVGKAGSPGEPSRRSSRWAC
jgi:type III restriction enzyme